MTKDENNKSMIKCFSDLYGSDKVLEVLSDYFTGKLVVKENELLHSVINCPSCDSEQLFAFLFWYRKYSGKFYTVKKTVENYLKYKSK